MDGRCTLLLMIVVATRQSCAAQAFEREEIPPGDAQSIPQLLVMTDGTVLQGRFAARSDGYDVTTRAGRMFIGSDRIRFMASDLPDAYKRMQETFSERTPENHMELARWCRANKLNSEARREVLDALHLDPHRGDAKRMLATLVDEPAELPEPLKAGPSNQAFFLGPRQQPPTAEAKSLAGLSRPIAQNFTRHVQPLLMNKCANAGCHGRTGTPLFQLVSAHRGSSPAIAETNLAAVLSQLNFGRPSSSPLLTAMEGRHANLTTPIFRGRIGSQQKDIIRDWVTAAAHDIAPLANAAISDSDTELQPASAMHKSSSSVNRANTGGETMTPHGRQLTAADTDDRFLADALQANARDAFDPTVFNRRFHSPFEETSRSSDSAATGPIAGGSTDRDRRPSENDDPKVQCSGIEANSESIGQ